MDPDTLAIWDDGLAEAWQDDMRITMLVSVYSYPPHPDQMDYYLGLHKDCELLVP